jgi:hypothetical protein
VRIVECAPDGVEVREEKVAVDEPVHLLVARGLLEPLQRVTRRRQQFTPTAPAHHADGCTCAVALGTGGEVEGRLRPAAGRHTQLATQRKGRAGLVDLDVDVGVRAEREGDDAGQGRAFEDDDAVRRARYAMRVVERARRAHALLPMAEHTLERERDGDRLAPAILERDRVHGAGHVRIAAIRREDGSADDDVARRAGEGRQPVERALPCHAVLGELDPLAVDNQRRTDERWADPGGEVRRPGQLDRSARPTMNDSDRVQ